MSNYNLGFPDRDIVAEPIRAFRLWRVWNEMLYPLTQPTPFLLGLRAECLRFSAPVAAALCSCGYWSVKTRELLELTEMCYANTIRSFFVSGEVEIWGNTTEHLNGYRSEFVRPVLVSLTVPAGYSASVVAARIEERYGCAVGETVTVDR